MTSSCLVPPQLEVFSNQLQTLGNGKGLVDPETRLTQFPSNSCTLVKFADDLMDMVFPSILQNYKPDWIREGAILAPKNALVANLNLKVLRILPGNKKWYDLIDAVMNPSDAFNYPTELLNSLDPPGCPPHVLHLKVGAPVSLL
ncbi:uncharacterized protein [Palaemon carinicauda]|uniref:uncharacterized protein n=1 Tax=Palaemon carinicauda TaxID=392227 RepID=UPI0035B5B0E0